MIRANLRLVVNIARAYTGKGLLPRSDRRGNLGFCAVEGFDPTVGTCFSTYASYWIKQSIKRALINCSRRFEFRPIWSKSSQSGVKPLPTWLKNWGGHLLRKNIHRLDSEKLFIIKKAIMVYNLTPKPTKPIRAGRSAMISDERMRTRRRDGR